MTRRTRAMPMLAIVTAAVAIMAIVSVVVMLGLLPAADLAVVGRLFSVAG